MDSTSQLGRGEEEVFDTPGDRRYHEKDTLIQREEENQHPDEEVEEDKEGGVRGWIVVAASVFCNMVIGGIGYSFGVLLPPIQREVGGGSGSVASIGSILAGVIFLAGPLSALGVDRLGTRATCVLGSFLASSAFLVASTVSSLPLLTLFYGVLAGLGLGLIYVPSMLTVGYYFTKKLSTVTGLCAAGSGLGTFIIAPLISSLAHNLDWRASVRGLAVLSGLTLLAGLLLVPGPKKKKQRRTSEEEGSLSELVRMPTFLLLLLANIPAPMAVYIPYTYLPSLAHTLHISPAQSSRLISLMGISGSVGGLMAGQMTGCRLPLEQGC